MIGRTVGHYRITARIGEGGMGVVYDTMLFSSPLFLADAGMHAPCDALVIGASALWTRPTEPKASR